MLKCNCDLTELIHPQKDYFIKKKQKQSSLYKPAVCVQQLTCQVCRRAQDIVGNVYAAVPPV